MPSNPSFGGERFIIHGGRRAGHDPEFMLEPYGDRPFKEMYRRPLYEGAGLTTVRSTEDAQRLLDHVLAQRYPGEFVQPERVASTGEDRTEVPDDEPAGSPSEAPMSENKGGVWGYGLTQKGEPAGIEKADEVESADAPAASFWTFDDAENP